MFSLAIECAQKIMDPSHIAESSPDAGPVRTGRGDGSLRSADEQERCDAFYSWEQSSRFDELVGESRRAVREKLGQPSRLLTLVHAGRTWLRAIYSFSVVPSRATREERASFQAGMYFAQSLLFRDGICVPQEAFDEEVLKNEFTATLPKHLEFHEGERSL